MKTQVLLSLFIVASSLGCDPVTLPINYAPTPDATSTASELADLTTSLADIITATASAPVFHALHGNGTQVVNGLTGTATFTWTKEVDDDGRTRTRTVAFADYTKNANSKLSDIDGTLTYTFSLLTPADAPATVTRTVKGKITATLKKNDGTTEPVTLEPDFTFTRDPVTRCVHMTGWMAWNNNKFQFQEKDHCVSDG